MHIRSINLVREGDWGQASVDLTKPLRAVIKVQGQHGNVELNLSTELSSKIIAIIAEEVAEAGRITAQAMVADIFTVSTLASPAPAPAIDEEMPF